MKLNRTARIAVIAAAALIALPAMAGAQAFVKNNFFGVGIDTPTSPLHAVRTDSGNFAMLRLVNNGAPFAVYADTNNGISWGLQPTGGGNFSITKLGSGGAEFLVKKNGDAIVQGSIFTADCSPCVSDYVFEPDYRLMPLDELAEFVATEKHLPNVPSQDDVDRSGKLNMSQMQMRMLEKIEELVLYTIDQQRTIDELTERLARLEAQ